MGNSISFSRPCWQICCIRPAFLSRAETVGGALDAARARVLIRVPQAELWFEGIVSDDKICGSS